MACKSASFDEDSGRYDCAVSGSQCMYLFPNSKKCSEDYGEGPDAEHGDIEGEDEESQYPFGYCHKCKKEFNSELINEYDITHCPWCGKEIEEDQEEPSELVYPPGTEL